MRRFVIHRGWKGYIIHLPFLASTEGLYAQCASRHNARNFQRILLPDLCLKQPVLLDGWKTNYLDEDLGSHTIITSVTQKADTGPAHPLSVSTVVSEKETSRTD